MNRNTTLTMLAALAAGLNSQAQNLDDTPALARDQLALFRTEPSLTLAPAEKETAGGGGSEEKSSENEEELAKMTQNPWPISSASPSKTTSTSASGRTM